MKPSHYVDQGKIHFYTEAILAFVKDRLLICDVVGDAKEARCKIQRKDEPEPAEFVARIDDPEIRGSRVAENYPAQLLHKRVLRMALLAAFPKVYDEMREAMRRS